MDIGGVIFKGIVVIGYLAMIFTGIRDIVLKKDTYFYDRKFWSRKERKFRYIGDSATLVRVSWLIAQTTFLGVFVAVIIDPTGWVSMLLLCLTVPAIIIGSIIQFGVAQSEEVFEDADQNKPA